jgi:hypothetical protein
VSVSSPAWPAASEVRSPLPLTAVALAGFVVAAHLEAAVQALPVSPALGGYLLAAAAGSGGWAVWAWRQRGIAVWAGIALFGSLAALWACSRTVGLPLGAGLRAPAGPLDGATFVDELLLVVVCVRWGLRRTGGGRTAAVSYAAVCVSLMLLSMGCTVGQASVSQRAWAAGRGDPLFCHLI